MSIPKIDACLKAYKYLFRPDLLRYSKWNVLRLLSVIPCYAMLRRQIKTVITSIIAQTPLLLRLHSLISLFFVLHGRITFESNLMELIIRKK